MPMIHPYGDVILFSVRNPTSLSMVIGCEQLASDNEYERRVRELTKAKEVKFRGP